MALSNLNQFLQAYFTENHCKIIHNKDGVLTVQLTEDLDKTLMNRPFYWHYIKKIGQVGEPMQLTLITNHEKKEENGEWIHFGSPRLQQIIHHLKSNGKYTKLYQHVQSMQKTALHPWLVTNIKISYIGKLKKDELFSIGLNLVNGMMKTKMMELLQQIELQKTIPDYCFTISPLIMLKSGFQRIERVLVQYISDQKHDWAEESLQTLKKELDLLKHFFVDSKPEERELMKQEEQAITQRYQPRVTMEVINGGIFYLTTDM